MTTPPADHKRLPSLFLKFFLAVLGVYALAGYILIPLIMEAVVPNKLSEHLNREVSIDNIALNPFFLTLTMDGLKIAEAPSAGASGEAPVFASWERMFINIRLFSGANFSPGIKTLQLAKPWVRVLRKTSGDVNFSDLLPGETTPQAAPPAPAPEAPDDSLSAGDPVSASKPFKINRLEIINGHVRFIDQAAPAVNAADTAPAEFAFNDINLLMTGFSTAPDTVADADLRLGINETAGIQLTAAFGIDPLTADARLTISNLEVPWSQPYLPPAIRLQSTAGTINLTADINVNTDKEKGVHAIITGETNCTALNVVERDNGGMFAALDKLAINGIRVTYNPLRVQADQILLSGLTQAVIISEDGGLNLARAFGAQPEKTAKTNEPASADQKTPPETPPETPPADLKKPANPETMVPPFPVEIGEVVLQDISADFTDQQIKPHYSAQLSFAEGRIKGLTSQSFAGAEMRIEGALDRHAPIFLSGTINPFLEHILLDAALRLQNMELSSVSPYTAKYIGRAVQQGKLNLDLTYTIREQLLTANNRILLDQFTLGEKINSPDDLNLPVGLAVSLLKDRRGEIKLDIPVSGRLDNPEFSVAAIVLQSLQNILVKSAASPFDLVASLVDGGEKLRYIAFDPGHAALSEQARNKLDSIDELLYKRPGLRLSMTGCVDSRKDRNALTRAALNQRLKKMKWTDVAAKQTGKEKTVDDIMLTETEYQTYLQTLYEQAGAGNMQDDKQTRADQKGAAQSGQWPDLQTMEALLLDQMTVQDAELLLLAKNRAQAVKDHLIALGRVEPARLFVLDSRIIFEKATDTMPAARVSLGLK